VIMAMVSVPTREEVAVFTARSAPAPDEQVDAGLLGPHDRCDRCGSQAYVSVRLSTGMLFFCAHHYQQYEARLRPLATSVQDERARLAAVS
jgi:hypothetical protein